MSLDWNSLWTASLVAESEQGEKITVLLSTRDRYTGHLRDYDGQVVVLDVESGNGRGAARMFLDRATIVGVAVQNRHERHEHTPTAAELIDARESAVDVGEPYERAMHEPTDDDTASGGAARMGRGLLERAMHESADDDAHVWSMSEVKEIEHEALEKATREIDEPVVTVRSS